MVYVLPRQDGVATDCRATGVAKVTAYREKRERKQRMRRGAVASKQRIARKESGNRECAEGQTLDSQQTDDCRVHPQIQTVMAVTHGLAGCLFDPAFRSPTEVTPYADRPSHLVQGTRDEGTRDERTKGPGTKGPRGQETGTGRDEALDPARRPEEVSLPQVASPTPLPRGCKPPT